VSPRRKNALDANACSAGTIGLAAVSSHGWGITKLIGISTGKWIEVNAGLSSKP
jgi:hypothetical protein